jgi:hypothetical protein
MFVGRGLQLRTDDINAEVEARSAAAKARETAVDVESMNYQIEKLLMITEALWNILKEKHSLTDEELINRVQDIDLQDGKLDGKVAKQVPSPCPKCGRRMGRNRVVCFYCGTPSTEYPFIR